MYRSFKILLIKLSKQLKKSNQSSVEFLLNNYSEGKALSIIKEKAETKRKFSIENLVHFYYLSGNIVEAKHLLEKYKLYNSLLYVKVAILEGNGISEIIDRIVLHNNKLPQKTAFLLTKGVKTVEDKEKIKQAVLKSDTLNNEYSIWRLRVIGEASRRAGDYKEALEAYRRAFKIIYSRHEKVLSNGKHKDQIIGNKYQEFDLKNAWRALNDFKNLAVRGWFIDAGTLLGFVREGNFMRHDYDLDISFIDYEAFSQTKRNLFFSPLFEMKPGRVKEVFKVRHVNGMDLDIFLYKRESLNLFKESHVYRWVFDEFELVDRDFGDTVLPVPSNPEKHLESIYGDWWVPREDFDGRYDAYNVSFPNIDELECVLLNKAIKLIQKNDYSAARKEIKMLKKIGRLPNILINNMKN